MTTQQYITIAVDNEFKTLYERNLVKVYLFYWLLKKPETNRQYYNFEIAFLIGIRPDMVSNYLWRMEKESNRRNDPFLPADFEARFTNVEKECVTFVKNQRTQAYIKSVNRSLEAIRRTNMAIINEYQMN